MLLDRERELDLLSDVLGSVGSSGGRVVLIRGEAGIGKSALLREFAASHDDEARFHYGFCDDLLTPRPLGPFWDIARNDTSLLETLTNGDRPGVLEALLELLSGSLRPNVVVIEDTHWADEATLDALKYLGRRIATTRGMLVLTYREGAADTDHPIRGVIGDLPPQSVVRVRLDGLSRSAVSLIIADTSLDPDEIYAATRGNPFLVTEMAGSERSDLIPSSVQDSVMTRVGKLSPSAHDVLKLLSVIPDRISRSELTQIFGLVDGELDECERRGLLDVDSESIMFRHELMRKAVAASLTTTEAVAANRKVLEALPADTDPARLVHHAREANDIDILSRLAPAAARAAARVGSHREAVQHFRQLRPLLSHLDPEARGTILREWAQEELLVDNIPEAIRLNELALRHYEEGADRGTQSAVLAELALLYEGAGQREKAQHAAGRALELLGSDPDGAELAPALEANGYLAMMAGNIPSVNDFVDRTLALADHGVDVRIIIRSLNHRGIVANVAGYPRGRESLDQARELAESSGIWFEECRALINNAWSAAEFRDLDVASEYAQSAIASAVGHELPLLESYATAIYVRVLELMGKWSQAEDLAREQLPSAEITQMVVLPILGVLEARLGRRHARSTLMKGWEMAVVADEFQRLAPAALSLAEYAWITGDQTVPLSGIREVMHQGLDMHFSWTPGAIALWLWKVGELAAAPGGIAEPYRHIIEDEPLVAADAWSAIGCPYERAIALTHGDQTAQLEALELLETLGAASVAARVRQSMRAEGMTVPRGKSRMTRTHPAGLTSRQAEVLQLLAENMTNAEIADHLFLSPRTVENHVSAVLMKLDSSTREEAVSRARADGMLAK